MAYVSSLFLQTALGRTPSQAAIALSPLMIGMIAASVVFRPLIERLGRRLVVIGLSVALAGAVVLWETVRTHGIPVSLWAMAPALFILGVGNGRELQQYLRRGARQHRSIRSRKCKRFPECRATAGDGDRIRCGHHGCTSRNELTTEPATP